MTVNAVSMDPVWEEKYAAGHAERAPWDGVVSFIFRYRPRDKERAQTKILEVGCGTASNLWFAAREGFDVSGLDGSESAIEYAKNRFAEERLKGDLRTGDFTALPFADESFDMAIDRGALTCAGTQSQKKAVAEVARILKPGGVFHFNPYSSRHSSAKESDAGPDDVRVNIRGGALTGVGQIRFTREDEIRDFLPPAVWEILRIDHETCEDRLSPDADIHAIWRIIARKKA